MFNLSLNNKTQQSVEQAISDHGLQPDFYATVEQFYAPLAQWIEQRVVNQSPHIVGIQGSQGSGKSTCAHFLKILLEQQANLTVAVVSLDDFYLTLAERQRLAKFMHPLLETRGVPGTHDVELIKTTFDAVRGGYALSVPTFSKANDDRAPRTDWQSLAATTNVLIFEGWCVGVRPQDASDLAEPANDLEALEDQHGIWRGYVNDQLAHEYHEVFEQLNTLVALQAPSFDCVYEWRLLQEQKLISKLEKSGKDATAVQTPEQLQRFIAHYQRLTEHALKTMPNQADAVLHLAADHTYKQLQLNGSKE